MDLTHLESRALRDSRNRILDESRLFHRSWIAYGRLILSRLGRPVALKVTGRVFVLLELFILHRLYGLETATFIGVALAADTLVFELTRPLIDASNVELHGIQGLNARRRVLCLRLFEVLRCSAGVSLVFCVILLLSFQSSEFSWLYLLVILSAPLRAATSLVTCTSPFTYSNRLPSLFSSLLRVLPLLLTVVLANVIGSAAFVTSFLLLRLLIAAHVFSRNRRIFAVAPWKSLETPTPDKTRVTVRVELIMMFIPGVALQLGSIVILAGVSNELLLAYLVLSNLINLSLFLHSQILRIPIQTLSRYARPQVVNLFDFGARRWRTVAALLYLVPIVCFVTVLPHLSAFLSILAPGIIPLLWPWLVLHVVRGWYRTRLFLIAANYRTRLPWTHQMSVLALGVLCAIVYFGTYDIASITPVIFIEAAILSFTGLSLRVGDTNRRSLTRHPYAEGTYCLILLRRFHTGVQSTLPVIREISSELGPAVRVDEFLPGILRIRYVPGVLDPDALGGKFASLIAAVLKPPLDSGALVDAITRHRKHCWIPGRLSYLLHLSRGEALGDTNSPASSAALWARIRSHLAPHAMLVQANNFSEATAELPPDRVVPILRHLRADMSNRPFINIFRDSDLFVSIGDEAAVITHCISANRAAPLLQYDLSVVTHMLVNRGLQTSRFFPTASTVTV